jgi:hypothetical protein
VKMKNYRDMKIFKYTIALALTLLVAASCRDEDAVRMPELQNGVNARVIIDKENSFFSLGDIDNTFISIDIYSINTDLEEIAYSGTYTDVSEGTKSTVKTAFVVPGSAFSNGKATIQVKATDIATAFGLPGGADALGGGDSFTLSPAAKLTDGRIVTPDNSAPSIQGGTNASFTANVIFPVACSSFEAADVPGDYVVSADPGEWATSPTHETEIIAGPGANQFTLKDALGYPQKFDMIITVDPATGNVTTAKQITYDSDYWGIGEGLGSTAGTGKLYSCAGYLTLTLGFTVDAGSFGTFKVDFQKVN